MFQILMTFLPSAVAALLYGKTLLFMDTHFLLCPLRFFQAVFLQVQETEDFFFCEKTQVWK